MSNDNDYDIQALTNEGLEEQLADAKEALRAVRDSYAELIIDVACVKQRLQLKIPSDDEFMVKWFGGKPGKSRPEREIDKADRVLAE